MYVHGYFIYSIRKSVTGSLKGQTMIEWSLNYATLGVPRVLILSNFRSIISVQF